MVFELLEEGTNDDDDDDHHHARSGRGGSQKASFHPSVNERLRRRRRRRVGDALKKGFVCVQTSISHAHNNGGSLSHNKSALTYLGDECV